MLQIICAAFQGMHQLPDGKQCRIAGVVVDIFQSGVNDRLAIGVEQLHMIAVGVEQRPKQLKMQRRHVGNENCVILLHFLGKADLWFVGAHVSINRPFGVPVFRYACNAANRLRRRIFTAPRLVISSILICV